MDKQAARQLVEANLKNLQRLFDHLTDAGVQLWLMEQMLSASWSHTAPQELEQVLAKAIRRCDMTGFMDSRARNTAVEGLVRDVATVSFLMKWAEVLSRVDGSPMPDTMIPSWDVVEALMVLRFSPAEESATVATT